SVSASDGYQRLRRLFEEHSLLLFRNQQLSNDEHLALGELFGPIEIREHRPEEHQAQVSAVSNVTRNGGVAAQDSIHLQQLQANQLWHTDSTFLPVPALANIITARVLPSSGGETELVSTRVAWRDLSDDIKRRVRGKVFCHRYANSRRQISEALAQEDIITMWGDQRWNAIWPNPQTGDEALYLASHIYGVEGMDESDGRDLLQELTNFCTQEKYVYTHNWRVGDVLIWDERATMHRGCPWPYDEPRHLDSICISVRDCDGLGQMRPGN
ncbi:MAG: TauD/TfdA family dioxygenase, partial [Pseudomonadota bacterium]